MKAQRKAVDYYRERTCTEDVIAIANEIARGITLAAPLNAKHEGESRSSRAQKGTH